MAEKARLMGLLPRLPFRDKQERRFAELIPDTGGWLRDDPKFKAWRDEGEQDSILWIYGKAGSGKSHVACSIIEELSVAAETSQISATDTSSITALAYVYCSSLDSNERNPRLLLGSIFKQLVRQFPLVEELPAICHTFEKRSEDPTMDDLKQGIIALSTSYGQTFIVVDGLDECALSGADNSPDFSAFCTFLSSVSEHSISGKVLKSIIFSRPDYQQIHASFSNSTSIETNAEKNGIDIGRYISIRLAPIRAKFDKAGDALDDITSKLVLRAEGTFLWINMAVTVLQFECTSIFEMQEALEEIPDGLVRMYKQGIQRIESQPKRIRERALNALLWITNAKGQLLKPQLNQALATRVGMTDWHEHNERMSDDGIVAQCADLIVLVDNRYELIHSSLRDYLTGVSDESVEKSTLYWQKQQNHTEILGEICLTFMGFECFDVPLETAQSRAFIETFLEKHPFLVHVGHHWAFYFTTVSRDDFHRFAPLVTRVISTMGNREVLHQVLLRNVLQAQHDGKNDGSHATALHVLGASGLLGLVDLCGDIKSQLNTRDNFGYMPLDYAMRCGPRPERMEKILWFLKQHITAREEISFGRWNPAGKVLRFTRVGRAAFYDWPEAIELLGSLGEDLNETYPEYQSSPLNLAAEVGSLKSMEMLLSLGADMEARDNSKRTPLCTALYNRRADCALMLLEKGANPNIKWDILPSCTTPLVIALDRLANNREVIESLLRHGADANVMGSVREYSPLGSPLHLISSCGAISCSLARLLVEYGGDVNCLTPDSITPLYSAVFERNTELVDLFLNELGADPDLDFDRDGWNPLLCAMEKSAIEIVKSLLKSGANPRVQTRFSNDTIVFLAAENGNLAGVEALEGIQHQFFLFYF